MGTNTHNYHTEKQIYGIVTAKFSMRKYDTTYSDWRFQPIMETHDY